MLVDIIVGLITTAVAAAAGYAVARVLNWYRFKHLRHLASEQRRIRIILPTLLRATFPVGHSSEAAKIPHNIPLMPMPEGKALAYLVSALRDSLADVTIEYVAPEHFVDDGTPFVSLGGPSVNSVSGQVLSLRVPRFNIKYPDHIANYGSVVMSPVIKDDQLQEDFGFLLQGKSQLDTKCIVVCGVWATGTEMACLAYADRLPRKSPARVRKHLLRHANVFLMFRAPISNYQLGALELMGIYDLSAVS
jgi:hypothetical protein